MIIVNGIEVKQEQFGDGTLKCEAVHGDEILANGNVIWWLYDNDAELFTLYCVVRDLQNRMPTAQNYLFMPYIPHARQDRNVSGRLFTLKYFSEIINSLNIGFPYKIGCGLAGGDWNIVSKIIEETFAGNEWRVELWRLN